MPSVLKSISILFSGDNLKSLYRFLYDESTMEEFDTVKAEKDDAIRIFNRRQRIKLLCEAFAALAILAQCSNLWLPIASDLLRETVAIFRSHLFVFALFNSILFTVYFLSAGISLPSDAVSVSDSESELYSQFVTNSKRICSESPPPEITKKTVVSENAEESVTSNNLTVAEPKSEANDSVCTDDGAIEAVLIVKSVRSASFRGRRSVSDDSRREFRRSYTDVRRRLSWCVDQEEEEQSATNDRRSLRSNAVNGMSDEEFNRKIDDFIATQKLIQQEEYKEERKTERFMALALCQ